MNGFRRRYTNVLVAALAHDNYQNRITAIDEGTVIARCHSRKPCRLIRNAFTDFWASRAQEILPFPLQMIKVGREAAMKARYDGRIEEGGAPAGQISGLITSVKQAGESVRAVVAKAVAVLEDGLGRRSIDLDTDNI